MATQLRVEVHDFRFDIGETTRQVLEFLSELVDEFAGKDNLVGRGKRLVQGFGELLNSLTNRGFTRFEALLRRQGLLLNE